jgi:hypothetical protein
MKPATGPTVVATDPAWVRYSALAILVLQNTALVLLLRYSRVMPSPDGRPYLPTTAVAMMEARRRRVETTARRRTDDDDDVIARTRTRRDDARTESIRDAATPPPPPRRLLRSAAGAIDRPHGRRRAVDRDRSLLEDSLPTPAPPPRRGSRISRRRRY